VQAYYATGIQMGIELTFPVPEGITVATMSMGIELCSMISTSMFGIAVREYGDFTSTMCMVSLTLLSTFALCLVPAKYKSEELEKTVKSSELQEVLLIQEKC